MGEDLLTLQLVLVSWAFQVLTGSRSIEDTKSQPIRRLRSRFRLSDSLHLLAYERSRVKLAATDQITWKTGIGRSGTLTDAIVRECDHVG
jgi:hypothetical protein